MYHERLVCSIGVKCSCFVKYNQMYCINAHYQEHNHLSYKVYRLSISTRLAATMTAIGVRNIVSRASEQAKSLSIIGSSLKAF